MKRRMTIILLLLLAALSCTAWAAGEKPEGYGEAELFQEGSLNGTQTNPEQLSLLSSEEDAYQRIYQGLCDRLTEIQLRDLQLEIEQFKALYERVINDHPELFYVQGGYRYSYSGSIVVAVLPNYETGLPDDAEEQLERVVEQALARIEPGMSQTEQALLLHDFLVEHVAYDWDVATTGTAKDQMVYNAYGALVKGDAVCQGYAEAYKLLLNRCGIDSVLVSSEAMNHAWNLVKIDGSWYHVDTTWDDPTPNLPGYCGHENFLRSDMGITGPEPNKGHYGWTVPEGIAASKENEPSGLFRETNNRVYYHKGAYYYLAIKSGRGSLYRADSLNDPEPETVQSNMSFFRHRYLNPEDGLYYSYPMYGVVWHEGVLYYVDGSKELSSYGLTDGSSAKLGNIPFEAADSVDGKYESERDTIGLYYDSKTGEIVAVSKTRPDTVLARFQVKDYPTSWDQMDQDTTALAGCVQKDSAVLQVGLVWAEQNQKAKLAAAFYQNDRLVKVGMVTSDVWTQGLNVLELDVAGYPDYDRVTLFLLSDSNVPYCEKKTA